MSPDPRAPLILFLGSARSGESQTLIDAGHNVGLLRDTECSYARHIPDGLSLLEEVPFSVGADGLIRIIDNLSAQWDITCLPVVFESHVDIASEVSRKLNYPAHAADTVLAVRNKTAMRDRLIAHLGPGCTGSYAPVSSARDAVAFAESVGYPVVLKPVQMYNSLHVVPCRNERELTAAVTRLTALLPPSRQGLRTGDPEMQVEEYLVGTDHSVDVVVRRDRAWPTPVVDVIAGASWGAADFHHYARMCPSALPLEACRQVQDLAVGAVRALGIHDGAAHVEFVHTAQGPKIIEVAARPGGNRHYLLHRGHGIDLIGAYVTALLGGEPDVTVRRADPVAVVTPYPSRAGILNGFGHLDEVRGLPSFDQLDVRATRGDPVGTPIEGRPAPLVVRLAHSDAHSLRSDLQRIWALRDCIIDQVG